MHKSLLRCFFVSVFIICLCGAVFAQTPTVQSQKESFLAVEGEVARPLKLAATDLAKLPRSTVKAKDHDGKEATYEGVALVEILKLAGVESGEKLRGKSLAKFLLVEAADGYRAVFALPELDPAFSDQVIILAERRDGSALGAREGPWQIIVPNDKRHGRWVRQVISFNLRRAE